MAENPSRTSVELAAEMTTAWLNNPNTRSSSGEVLAFLDEMHQALLRLREAGTPRSENARPGLNLSTSDRLPPYLNDDFDGETERRSPEPVPGPSSYQIPLELKWGEGSIINTEFFDDVNAAKDRARELIQSGEATSATLSDADEIEVASFVRLTPLAVRRPAGRNRATAT